MRVREFLRQEKDIGRTDLVAIMAFVLATSTERIYMDPERELPEEACRRIREHVAERKKGKPLSYITGRREFFSEEFFVDERVLVPRPETELLVEEALRIMAERPGHKSSQRILDMGTGSGIIGITIARHGNAAVTCVDISLDALLVARANAARLGVQDKVACVCSDLFSSIKMEPRFDIIVANLPYVSASEWHELMTDVKFEPKTALLGGTLGTEVYERFVAELPGRLGEDGFVLCELGGTAQIEARGRLDEGTRPSCAFEKGPCRQGQDTHRLMEKLVIEGGERLRGRIAISGAKNAVLPVLAATLLQKGVYEIGNVPRLKDVTTMINVLELLGAKSEWVDEHRLKVDTTGAEGFEAPYDLVKEMRASVLVLGALAGGRKRAIVSYPGGCAIGERPINLHLKGLSLLGCEVGMHEGYVDVKAENLCGAKVHFEKSTVGGTENILMAAVLARGETVIENAAMEPEVVDLGRDASSHGRPDRRARHADHYHTRGRSAHSLQP